MRPRTAALLLATLLTVLLAGGCDNLRRKPPATGEPTAALALRVRLELLQKLGADGLRVDVEAEDGEVRLAGEVRRRATARNAEEIALRVAGVRSVKNDIRVTEGAAASRRLDSLVAGAERELRDAGLETRVRLALVDRLGSDGFRIGTDAVDGVVTLKFPAAIERARRRDAARTAKRVEGVQRVISLDAD
jgi:osmotically-inducible protein OsmY